MAHGPAWLGSLLLTGSFWYVRNLLEAGSPLPSVSLPAFPRARFEYIEAHGFSVASYLDEPDVVRRWIVPGLGAGVSRAWPIILLICFGAVAVGALRRSPRTVRMVCVVVGFSVVTYVLTPTTAMGVRFFVRAS